MPGARPKGSLPYIAIATQPTIAARAVEVNTAPSGMFNSLKMLGLTARMYDMVRKIVIPAIISVRRLCCFESKPKSLLSIVLCCGWVIKV